MLHSYFFFSKCTRQYACDRLKGARKFAGIAVPNKVGNLQNTRICLQQHLRSLGDANFFEILIRGIAKDHLENFIEHGVADVILLYQLFKEQVFIIMQQDIGVHFFDGRTCSAEKKSPFSFGEKSPPFV